MKKGICENKLKIAWDQGLNYIFGIRTQCSQVLNRKVSFTNDHIHKEAKKTAQLHKALIVQMQIQKQLQQLALPQEIQMQNQFQ